MLFLSAQKNVGCKNRIDKDNLGGSQLCALCKRLCLKISWKYNSLQILRVSGRSWASSVSWATYWICVFFLLDGYIHNLPPSLPQQPAICLLPDLLRTHKNISSLKSVALGSNIEGDMEFLLLFFCFPFSGSSFFSLPLPQWGQCTYFLPHSAPRATLSTVTVTAAILVVIYLHKLPDRSW